MSQPTRGLVANGSKVNQLRAQSDELMQHLDDAAQLEDIQQQAVHLVADQEVQG